MTTQNENKIKNERKDILYKHFEKLKDEFHKEYFKNLSSFRTKFINNIPNANGEYPLLNHVPYNYTSLHFEEDAYFLLQDYKRHISNIDKEFIKRCKKINAEGKQ